MNGIDLIKRPVATLDEIYFITNHNGNSNNNDVQTDPKIRTSLMKIFQHDYWGRPMNSPSSHKSYRPITVISFRLGYYLAEVLRLNGLFVQRALHVVIHSVMVQMVGRLYESIFKCETTILEHILSRGLFLLHPTHIETVVNMANRSHLLSLMFTLLSLDLTLNSLYCTILYTLALLSCETALFALPAIYFTWMCIDRVAMNSNHPSASDNQPFETKSLRLRCKALRIGRMILMLSVALTYLFMRHKFDWIDIPRDLIRRAENPFYTLKGMDRFLSYSFVLAIHLVKCLGMGVVNIVGFSHEYGYDCVHRLDSLHDKRLALPLFLLLCLLGMFVTCFDGNKKYHNQKMLLFVTFVAWMATLFPVSGFIRVGTFIADRIVIASTVASSILWTRVIKSALAWNAARSNVPKRHMAYLRYLKVVGLYLLLISFTCYSCLQIQKRSTEWMFPVSLLSSSLDTCPFSAKSNLEMSKVYSSGLFGIPVDLNTALSYAEKARDIDPEFCDVNLQLAQIYIQKNRILDFENTITKGVICRFTMQDAYSLFQQYWSKVLREPVSSEHGNNKVKERYNFQLKIIQKAIQDEKQSRNEHDSNAGNNSFQSKDHASQEL